MRGLASYAMGGRFRALLVAVAGAGSLLFVWISAAIIALVTLRKGTAEGLMLLLWACLPAAAMARLSGDSTTLALLLGTALLAVTLRNSVSLALTVLVAAFVAIASGAAMMLFADYLLAELVRVFGEVLNSLEESSRAAGQSTVALKAPSVFQVAGMLGVANGALSLLCLMLGRYWQAALYNPGGFGAEFRALRLPAWLVWLLCLAALAIASRGLEWRSWGSALLLPLAALGFALLHARARVKGQSGFWLGGIYAAWLVFDVAKLALIGLVLADSVLDFRGRWQGNQGGPQDAPRAGERRVENDKQAGDEADESQDDDRRD